MNAQGVPTPSQLKRAQGSTRQLWNSERMRNEWNRSTVDRILRDERYTGKLIGLKHTRTEVGNYNSMKPVPKEDWVVVPDAFEAIIPQEIFDQVAEKLQKHVRKRAASTPDESRIFVRKLKCAGCGLALDRRKLAAGWHYVCGGRAWEKTADCVSTRLSEEQLTRAVLESIHMQAKLARDAERELNRREAPRRRAQDTAQKRRRDIQTRLERLTGQKKEVFLRYDRGELSRPEFDAQCRLLAQKTAECKEALSGGSQGTNPAQVAHTLLCRAHIRELKKLEQIDTLDRETVDKLIRSIKVYAGNRIEIVWNFGDSLADL